jgi:50S ribosomal subunit-associated GTPase HflX
MDVREADLLLHVVDASSPRHAGRIEVVHSVLENVLRGRKGGAGEAETIPTILILNKRDLMEDAMIGGMRRKYPEGVLVSAAEKEGLEELLVAIEARIEMDTVAAEVLVSTDDGKGISAVEENARVLSRSVVDGRLHFEVSVRRRDISLLEKAGEVRLKPLRPQ